MLELATIQKVVEVAPHPNADRLDLIKILGYECVVSKDQFKVGDDVIFIAPDSILPEDEWAIPFKKFVPKRVKAIKIRNSWSFGLVIPVSILQTCGVEPHWEITEGFDVTSILNIKKYEAPAPKSLEAKGGMPFGLFKTDEDRAESLRKIPFGERGLVTLKIDGQSATYFCKLANVVEGCVTGICSRTLEIKPESNNNYTQINKKYDILTKLSEYCLKKNRSLALRGEIFGGGVQGFKNNPHAKLPLDFNGFNVLDLDTLKYVSFDEAMGIFADLNICYVPVLGLHLIDPDVIKFYSETIDTLDYGNGKVPFEGVVIKFDNGFSFKVINKDYDSKK